MEKYLLGLIRLLITVISPEIRNSLVNLLNKLEADAKKTANEWDDVIVGLLKSLLLGDNKPGG